MSRKFVTTLMDMIKRTLHATTLWVQQQLSSAMARALVRVESTTSSMATAVW